VAQPGSHGGTEGMPPVPPPPPLPPAGADDTASASGEPGEPGAGGNTAPPGADLGDGTYVGPVTSVWARTPLRVRLISIVTIMLLTGLGISMVLTSTVLSRYLTDQLDSQLEVTLTSTQVIPNSVSQYRATGDFYLPSDYFILAFFEEGGSAPFVNPTTTQKYGIPALTAYTFAGKTMPSDAFTIGAVAASDSGGSSEWRARAFTYPDGGVTGYLAVPLEPVEHTVSQIQRVLLVATLVLTALGGGIGYVAIRRSLRPLHTIERTAARIADGDLSQRVPQAPRTTEVGSLAHSLNSMLAQIEQSFDAQEASEARMRRFVSDASHELRTPLATVRGYGELYRMGALTTPEAMDDTMRRIEDSATRMGTLVNDLLALARLDEGRAIRSDPVDLRVLARDSVDDLHALDPTRRVRLTALDGESPAPPATVVGDEDRLRQVLTNLIGNVARHTPAGTAAEVALGPSDDGRSVVVEVRDHGPGIPEDQAHRVFERFYRADSSRNRASGGSGLGMAIVAAIVGAHQGTVTVARTPGGGLTVHAELPVGGASGTTSDGTQQTTPSA
jgi:two-component system OmpR family sensor kinase